MSIRFISFLLLSITIGACQWIAPKKEDDKTLAKVHNKTLYLSELEGMFPEGTTGADSSLIINAFVSRWVREALLLNEAERNIPTDLNIDKLVRDYRASLIKHNYEQVLVQQLLDSVVTQNELQTFFDAHREQFNLKAPIMRCYLIKTPLDAPNLQQLGKWWNSNDPRDFAEMVQYCNTYSTVHLLEDSIWHDFDKIAMQLPRETLSADRIDANKTLQLRDGKFHYLFRLFEYRAKNEAPPLGYVEDQARKLILYRRKLKLLEDTKEELFEREMRSNNIQIFTQ